MWPPLTAFVWNLSLARLNSVTVLACYNFDLLCLDNFVRLHLELCVLDYERPYVVTETVCAQMSLLEGNLVSTQLRAKRYQIY